MSGIAEDIVEGACCAFCGQYFVKEQNVDGSDVPVLYEHGYPVACEECWEEDCGHEKATAKTIGSF